MCACFCLSSEVGRGRMNSHRSRKRSCAGQAPIQALALGLACPAAAAFAFNAASSSRSLTGVDGAPSWSLSFAQNHLQHHCEGWRSRSVRTILSPPWQGAWWSALDNLSRLSQAREAWDGVHAATIMVTPAARLRVPGAEGSTQVTSAWQRFPLFVD